MENKTSAADTISVSASASHEKPMNEKLPRVSTSAMPAAPAVPAAYPGATEGPRPLRRRAYGTEALINAEHGNEQGLSRIGRIYDRVLNSSIIIRYAIYMLPVSGLFAIPLVLGFTKYPNAQLGSVRICWIAVWAEVVWNSLWIWKLLAKALPHVFQFLSGWVNPSSRKFYQTIKACEVQLSFIGWALTSWLTFLPIMTQNPWALRSHKTIKNWESNLNNLLVALLFSSIVWFIEKFCIQLIAINYHRKAFRDKIVANKARSNLVIVMYEASIRMFPQYCDEFAEEDYLISHATNETPAAVPDRRKSGAVPRKVVMELSKMGDAVGGVFSRIAQEVTGKKGHTISDGYTIVREALEKTASSEALARRLYATFSGGEVDMLTLEDFVAIIGKDKEAEATRCFDMLDKDGNGDVSEQEFISGIVGLGHGMRSLAFSVRDVQECVRKLDDILLTVVALLTIYFILVFVSSAATTKIITSSSAYVIGLTWLFGSTGAEFLNSCIFIFAKHPYDVGDRVDIGADSYTVEHIDLMYTVFKRLQNHKLTQVANNSLAGGWIDNVSRSKSMRDSVKLFIHFDTSNQDLNLLRSEMTDFVRDKENSRDFQPDIHLQVDGVAEMNKLELTVCFDHKSNWSNESLRAMRRTKFLCGLRDVMGRIPIYSPGGGGCGQGDAANPAYSITTTPEEAAAKKETWTNNKVAKRMVPVSATPERIYDPRNETGPAPLPPTPGADRTLAL